MIFWHLDEHLRKHDIPNASQLAIFAGLTYPTAARVLRPGPVKRFETVTLELLALAFGVRNPLTLLRHEPTTRR